MTELTRRIFNTKELSDFIRRINAGENPNLSRISSVPPYIDAIDTALRAAKPRTEKIEQYLLYVESLRSEEKISTPRVGIVRLSDVLPKYLEKLSIRRQN